MEVRPFYRRLKFRMTCGLVLALLAVGVPFFLFFIRFHEQELMQGVREPLADLSGLVFASLERRMLEKRPHLLDRDISEIASQSGAARITLLDLRGQVKVSSDPSLRGRVFERNDALCAQCHRQTGKPAQASFLTTSADKSTARHLFVIRNRAACHECHDPGQAINGILVVDLPLAQTRRQLRSGITEMLVLGAAMVLITIAALSLLIDRLVLRRLRSLQKTAVAIREGELNQKADATGSDEVSELADAFNVMTASLKESLRELQGNKAYLENLINSIEDEIVVIDRRFQVVTANSAYFAAHNDPGFPLEQRPFCVSSGDRCDGGASADFCPSRLTFETGQVEKRLYRRASPGGQECFIEVHSYPLRNERNEIFQAVEVRRDITQRRFLEARLCQSERLASLGLLASGISHEINNPLASIVACSEGLAKRLTTGSESAGQADLAEIREYLGLIHQEAMRAKTITQRLLILAHKSDSRNYLVSLNQSLSESAALLRFQAESRGIRIVESLDPNLPLISGDDPALRQVFLNLLLNAMEAIEADGQITVSTGTVNGSLCVTVQDTGCGIPEADFPQLFEPFFSNRKRGSGTGLGLFISSLLIRGMGGALTVQSEPGKGSIFSIVLPRGEVRRPSNQQPPESSS